jgi:hypothetical protein
VPEIGTLGLMSGGGKRIAGHRPQVTAPTLDSTFASDERILMTAVAPGCVKTCADQKSLESYSNSPSGSEPGENMVG